MTQRLGSSPDATGAILCHSPRPFFFSALFGTPCLEPAVFSYGTRFNDVSIGPKKTVSENVWEEGQRRYNKVKRRRNNSEHGTTDETKASRAKEATCNRATAARQARRGNASPAVLAPCIRRCVGHLPCVNYSPRIHFQKQLGRNIRIQESS